MDHVSSNQLAAFRDANQNRRLIFVVGQFNVIHAGHIRLLKFAKSLGDKLVVALLPDGAGAYVPQALRLAAMKSVHMVDHAFVIKDNVQACVEALKPNAMVKGAEHEKRNNPEHEWLRPWGGES